MDAQATLGGEWKGVPVDFFTMMMMTTTMMMNARQISPLKKTRVLVGLNKNLTLANLDVFFSAEVPGSFCEACAKGVVGVCWCF